MDPNTKNYYTDHCFDILIEGDTLNYQLDPHKKNSHMKPHKKLNEFSQMKFLGFIFPPPNASESSRLSERKDALERQDPLEKACVGCRKSMDFL